MHTYGGKFCDEHTCHHPDCKKSVIMKHLRDYSQVKSKFCVEHSSSFCDSTKFSECKELSVEGGLYCAKHTCQIEGCLNESRGSSKETCRKKKHICNDHHRKSY
jgi:hypothetical protein